VANNADAHVATTNDGTDDANASFTVNCPHLTISKAANPVGPVTAGNPIGFDITVGNSGPGTAHSVTVSDTLPTVSGQTWSINPAVTGCTITTGALSCTFNDKASGWSQVIHVTSQTTTADCTTYQNQASTSASNNNPLTVTSSIASVTVTCPAPAGQITPTQTTCAQFKNGTASSLGTINYTASNGKISQNVNPGVFFYWLKVTAVPNVSNTFHVTEAATPTPFPIFLLSNAVQVFDSNCSGITGASVTQNSSSGTVTAAFTAGQGTTYFLGIKYSSKSAAGFSVPSPLPTYHYTFQTTEVGVTSKAFVDLAPAP
jgi:hypothetical protein